MAAKQVSWLTWGPSYHKVSRREEQVVPFEGSAGVVCDLIFRTY